MAQEIGGASRHDLTILFQVGSLAGLTDGQLLERFATGRGDAAELAFSALVERHGPMVQRVCRTIVRDEHEAMDAFQATFLVLVRKGRSLWVRDSLGPWLHRVACRAAGRARAQADRRWALERKLAAMTVGHTGDDDRSKLAAAVQEEVDGLPDRFRVPIILCDLQGQTCEEAARHLGCPIGTIGSRLARGRERLRGRLIRRGLAPAVGTVVTLSSSESRGGGVSATLMESTVRLGLGVAARQTEAGVSSAASAKLAEEILKGLHMTNLISVGTATAAVGIVFVTSWVLQPDSGTRGQPIEVKAPAKVKRVRSPADRFPFMNDKDRFVDMQYAEFGNMRPVIHDEDGYRFQSRQAILYKDGTAKLWSLEQKDPIAPALSHEGPIRELTFFAESNLLITTSDRSIKVWNALTGELRAELDGQGFQPLWLAFAPKSKRFVTLETERKTVTVWDAVSLKAIATLQLKGTKGQGVATGLSDDGKSVVTFDFGTDPSVELWDVASGQSFATLRPPSSAVASVFSEKGTNLNKNGLILSNTDRGTPFWGIVRDLAPRAGK
ncbi:RNA polymerase sigma factor, sigma-70 family [Singulisphaera sp. GP187]|uniref:sigma-70 family RNA polymerase sigma factor n=1 Tax=Singulisphaera sp. GP187 TaxID=1882752 RepID=UPI0009284E61|nr:sigma-70 family RNA polymerase sigma factor [Singulisphaera sp. GP187]SIO66812.1 RNA polymerase sigma factor, sigma-70 family [Singulisphaera sp. GP187]